MSTLVWRESALALLPSSTKTPVASSPERRSAGRVVVVGGSVVVVAATVVEGVDVDGASVVEGAPVESDATDVVAAAGVSVSSEVDCCHTNQAPTARTPTTATTAIPTRNGRPLDVEAAGGTGGVAGGGVEGGGAAVGGAGGGGGG
jgi:hypothetical protein